MSSFLFNPKVYTGAGVICIHKSKILCVKGIRSKKWGFPKGHVEQNETHIQCAIREFMEESGYTNLKINLKSNKFLGKRNIYFIVPIHSFKILGEHKQENIDVNEIDEVKWFELHNLKKIKRQDVNIDLWSYINS